MTAGGGMDFHLVALSHAGAAMPPRRREVEVRTATATPGFHLGTPPRACRVRRQGHQSATPQVEVVRRTTEQEQP